MDSSNIQEPSVSKRLVASRTRKNRKSRSGRSRPKNKSKAKKRVPKKEVVEEESSPGPMDHQLIERITLRNTMGDDAETLRGDLERLQERGTRFEGMSPSDEDKYEYGRRYTFDKDNIYQPRANIPWRQTKAFKKNKETLMDMHRRDYERTKEKQLIKGSEVAPYPSPINVEDDILQNSFMPEYLYIPEERLVMKDEEDQYREGMKLLYKEGETPPELYKLTPTVYNFKGGVSIIPELISLALALSMYTATFVAENVRAGIQGVGKGQKEAAASIGLTRGQILKLVVMPQALRIIIPPTTNQYLNLTKNSSLAAAIAYPDIVLVFAGTALMQTGRAIEIISITMGTYLFLSLTISVLMNSYNKKMAIREK